jgi:hypothetical protein
VHGKLVFSMFYSTFFAIMRRFVGNDSRGAVAPPLNVQVLLCNCEGHGSCSWSRPQQGFTLNDMFVNVSCLCYPGYQGMALILRSVIYSLAWSATGIQSAVAETKH